jgi:hypothetical protein
MNSMPPGRGRIRGAVTEGRDGEAVDLLAALSGRTPPSGAVLLAERDGESVAAIGIFDGKLVADHAGSSLRLRMQLRLARAFLRTVIAVRGI